MKELAVILAAAMPKEDLVDQLSQSIEKYKITNSDDDFEKVAMHCSLVMIKSSMGQKNEKDFDAVEKTLKNFEEIEAGRRLIKTNES